MNSRDMEYIRAIAEEGSITRAAERLHIAQPSLTQCVNRVEARLGVPLFIRTNTGVTLTYACELFLNTADTISKAFRDLENSISEMNGMQSGRVTVGVPTLLASQIMPGIYSSYARKYPNIELVLFEEDSKTLVPSLQRGKIDLAIMALPIRAELDYEIVMSCPMVLCAPPNHELLRGVPPYTGVVDLSCFGDQPFIRARPHQKTRFVADAVLRKAGINVRTVLMTSSSETAMFLSSHGLGFTLLPEFSIRYYRPLRPIEYYRINASQAEEWNIVIARPRNSYLPRAAKLFIDEVHTVCKSL